ncbi:MAG: hypothetical protein HY319_23780 [Armatimonadetes bacterium]|nr:hypothetical protein [Armatimonadota bacterium]
MTMASLSTPVEKTVGELVEVPPIRTVIQLSDASEPGLQEEIVESFVFTREVTDLFSRLLGAMTASVGMGAFLKGHYGSGKSHCLTFLQRLLEGDEQAWRRVPPALASVPMRARKWLCVPVSLLVYPASSSLESILMEAIEQAFASRMGNRPVLAHRTRLLEHFRHLILPHYRDQLKGWEELDEDRAARRALEFLRSLPENPLSFSFDRRKAMGQVHSLLGEAGLVLLIDELSEFLRSKKDDAFNEDIRYLQFLGEFTQHMPLFVVATLQQNLEELGYGQQEGFIRIKERYSLRFSLSARHVADLVEGRLIVRRPGSEQALAGLWRDLDRAFPGLVSEADFRRCYPVHPLTLELLEWLMPLFSRHRGVVDFVHARLAGDPIKGAAGILDEPADRLLTPDAIFDHFRERFAELPELAAYESVALAFLEKDVPSLFESERDRDLALRLVKILILAEVSPQPVRRDADSLARMTARRISRLEASVNTEYLRQNILDALVARSAFVCRRGEEYGIDLEANLNQVLGRRLRGLRRDLLPDWSRAVNLVNRAALPLKELSQAWKPTRFLWHNTPRGGLVGLGDVRVLRFEDFALGLRRLEEDLDFCLWLGTPDAGQEEAVRILLEHARAATLGRAVVFWLPADPDPELSDRLLDHAAHLRLREELLKEGAADAVRTVEQTLAGIERELERGVAELYATGTLHHLEGRDPCPHLLLRWDDVLLAVVGPRLERVFFRHAEVSPELDCLTQRNLDRIWEDFLEPGRCPRPSRSEALMEGLVLRLGLAVRESHEYRLDADPLRAPLVAELVDRLLPREKVPLSELETALRRGPFGLARECFWLVVAGLVQAGRATPYASGRATGLTSLRDLSGFKVDALGPGTSLDPVLAEQLGQAAWLWPEAPPGPVTPSRQRELWEAALKRLLDLGSRAGTMARALQEATGEQFLPSETVGAEARELEATCRRITSSPGATSGLKRLLASEPTELQVRAQRLERWDGFLRQHLGELREARVRLGELNHSALLSELSSLPEVVDPLAFWSGFRQRYHEAVSEHQGRYLEAHRAHYQADAFGLRQELEKSPEWQALERLGVVLGLEAEPSPARLRHLAGQLPRPCRRRVEDQLVLGVRCECGFSIGDPAPQVPDLVEEARCALVCAAGWLTAAPSQERLEAHLRHLRQVGQEERARGIEAVLAAAAELAQPRDLPAFWGRICGQLVAALDPRTLQALNRALTGHPLLVPRRLEDLARQLEGQRLPPARLRQLFERWLEADPLPDDAWVHVQGENSDAGAAGRWLAAWLAQHEVAPNSSLRRRYELEPPDRVEDFSPEAAEAETELLAAGALEEITRGLQPVQAALVERLFPKTSSEFCRRALRRALENPVEAGRLARELPAGPWEHLEAARSVASTLERVAAGGCAELARALREWARVRDLDLGCGFLTPDLEQGVQRLLEERLAATPLEGLALAEVPEQLVRPLLGHGPLVVLVIDALRWDLWELLRPLVEAELGPALRETVAVAPYPSVTREGRVSLLTGSDPRTETPRGADGLLLGRSLTLLRAADERRHRERCLDLLKSPPPALMLHLGFVDRRIHESQLELWPLYQELLAEAKGRLTPLIRAVPSGSTLLITADHGFLAPGEPGRRRLPHGGDSLQERLVPAAVWVRE